MSATTSQLQLQNSGETATDSSISISISGDNSALLNSSSFSGERRHLGMTQAEVLTSAANRILHSKFYKWLYLAMMIMSLFCLALSFIQQCPSGLYYWMDAIVNITMIVEVLIRVNAMGKNFWKSIWNQIDIALVFLCILTLFWLIFGECQVDSANWETELDALLLIARNAVQLFRLISMVNKNRQQLLGRSTPAAIDFNNAAPTVDFLGVNSDLNRSTTSASTATRAHRRAESSVFDFEGEEEDWGF